jgi:DNA mismatch endonuclease Vsr
VADTLSPERRSALMARVGPRNTKPEMIVRRLLHARGWRYRLHRKGLPGTPDLVFPSCRAAIFVHGCFWHGHTCRLGRLPRKRPEFWFAKIAENRDRDARKVAGLVEAGWRAMTVWQCSLLQPDAVIEDIEEFLRSDCKVASSRTTEGKDRTAEGKILYELAENEKSAAATEWVFELNPPMGGATGEAFTNTLASSGMRPAAVLAREAIQNSVDAHRKDQQKVTVDFITKLVVDAQKAAFVKTAGLDAIASRADKLGFKEPNCLGGLHDPNVPLNLLYVDDHYTTGLEGDPANPESKFSRFLLSLGDGGKEHEEHGTGGSYGFGKSVYSSNSAVLTIFAYSRTVDGEGKPMSLLFGCGYYRKHKHSDKYFTGRVWFGHEETTGHAQAQQKVVPLLGDEAISMAAALGFVPRAADDLGTSVLIVDAVIDPASILEGVEDWWWPRLISSLLDVKVVDADGKAQLPRPRKREHLRPFLEAFEIAIGKSPPNGKTEFRKPFNKSEGDNIGSLGFTVLERNDNDEFAVDDSRLDSVALIRSPLMVVAYQRHWMVGSPVMVGAFVAAEDIDDILRAAEPPAHDRWDRDARRLQDQSGRKRQIVDKVLNGIRRSLKQCQTIASQAWEFPRFGGRLRAYG